MHSRVLNTLLAASLLILFGSTAQATSGPCANLALSVSPASAGPGQTVTLSASISDCASAPEALRIDLKLTGPMGISDSGVFTLDLAAGSSDSVKVPIQVPFMAPPGKYTLNATAYVGTMQVGFASATATVI